MLESLKSLFARTRPIIRPTRRFRPRLESLESRLAPAASLTAPPALVGQALVQPNASSASRVLEWCASVNKHALRLQFREALGKGVFNPATYHIPGLAVRRVGVSGDQKTVLLITEPQVAPSYTLQLRGLSLKSGKPVSTAANTATVYPTSAYETADKSLPRVTGAGSIGNNTVLVSFSRGMNNSAVNPLSYVITQANVNPEAGTLKVLKAEFFGSRRVVKLTTESQNELTYAVTVYNVRDLLNRPLPAPGVAFGVLVDPRKASFPGTPPAGRIDTDGDGLTDNEEQRGWAVQFKLIDGSVAQRGVTSDPRVGDSDGDGLPDSQEATLRLDPRDMDTDDDQLTDNQEFNEIYSDPTKQDSDGDGLDDSLEFNFFRTSPVHADTDGDQLADGDEVLLAKRNARVADLPTPAIEVGATSLRLDVRFTETTATGTRTLDSKSVNSTLTQSERKAFSNSNSNTQEATAKITSEIGGEVGYGDGGFQGKVQTKVAVEAGWTGTWNTTHNEESSQETVRAYAETLNTEVEATKGATVERQVVGAQLQATLFVQNASSLAYRVQNLQLTAFVTDPLDPAKLTPVATLLPEAQPEGGFTLGPLVPRRGPFVFSSTTVFPSLVESLMANPRGLVYKIANFDITDELGRNFAFSSTDVIDRTGSVVIDFGGFDNDGDGEGDLTEYHRVATNAGRVIDTNGDGQLDDQDRRVVFDGQGDQVGITLREALAALGLAHYDEAATPTSSLTPDQLSSSYSTYVTPEGQERIFRVRQVAIEDGLRKQWVVLTPTGIDPEAGLDDTVLRPDSDVKLAFVQDLDGDLVPANVEALLGTSDDLKDSDTDGLDDRFEAFLGWDVDLRAKGVRHVLSSPTNPDSDGDGLEDIEEAPANLIDANGDGVAERAERAGPGDLVTDPLRRDTDLDGVGDHEEVHGYQVTPRSTGVTVIVKTDPANFDTDGDTGPDGLERRLGGNPTIKDLAFFADDDRDGLTNFEETAGWTIKFRGVSTRAFVEGSEDEAFVTSDPDNPDSDGDGLSDGEEFALGADPRPAVYNPAGLLIAKRGLDTDNDGLSDLLEARGFQFRDQGFITLNPLDADYDNDRLTDGFEADLTGADANRWVVRLEGQAPYQVHSDPRVADADLDGLADGDEYDWSFLPGTPFPVHADPTKANTDGDRRDDFEEHLTLTGAPGTKLNPLVDDFLVTVYYTALGIGHDWATENGGSAAGGFTFNFGVRLPDQSRTDGLSAALTDVIVEGVQLVGPQQAVDDNFRHDVESRLPVPEPDDYWDKTISLQATGWFGVPIGEDWTLNLLNYLTVAQRSVTFRLAKNERFSIEGVVVASPPGTGNQPRSYVYFGGMDGIGAEVQGTQGPVRGVFEGATVASQTITDVTYRFDNRPNGPSGAVFTRYVVS
jgi:hypothetical protein